MFEIPVPTVSEEIGIKRLDPLARDLMDLYSKGRLATFVRGTRKGPLEVPIKPELMGVPGVKRIGRVTRRLSYKVCILNEKDNRTFDKHRKSASDQLRRFSHPLSNGHRWIPVDAIPLFERELKSANAKAVKQLEGLVGNDVDQFLKNRREEILRNLSDMCQESHPGKALPENIGEEVMAAAKKRLGALTQGNVMPKLSYMKIQFHPGEETDWRSQWGQAFTLLESIAQYPRNLLTASSPMGRLSTRLCDLLNAMNVLDDPFVETYKCSRSVAGQAANDLKTLPISPTVI